MSEPASGEHRTLTAMDKNDDRFEIRLPKREKEAILAGAQEAGQNPSVFARRALAATLSEAKDGSTPSRLARPSVPSENPEKGIASDGVRPAASPRASNAASDTAVRRAITSQRTALDAALPRRADVGPKPASASKPRPKAGSKTKAKP